MTSPSAHVDTFVRDRMPAAADAPELIFELPELQFPDRLNCGVHLLGRHLELGGRSGDTCLIGTDHTWTYGDLLARSSQIAHVLVDDLGVVPGNRVLLIGHNRPLLVAAWYAVMLAGGVAVTVAPSSPADELHRYVDRVQPTAALYELPAEDRVQQATAELAPFAGLSWTDDAAGELPALMATKPTTFAPVATAADDPCLIAFTSGSEGPPKAVVHTHRDVISVCAVFASAPVFPGPGHVFAGSAPLAFTFGLIALACFPLYTGGSVIMQRWSSSKQLAELIEEHRASVCFTVPTVYRQWLRHGALEQLRSLRLAVSSGEPLSAVDWHAYRDRLGVDIVNCLGSTEMLHAFMSTARHPSRPGSIGFPIRGYRARIIDATGRDTNVDEIGMLAVKGPTGCRYLDDARQRRQVRDGWTMSGDLVRRDAEGYFWFEGRADRSVNTKGHNVSPAEVELALLDHPDVVECAVVGVPDVARGASLKAIVSVREGFPTTPEGEQLLKDFLLSKLSPYKCPRVVEFVSHLPRTSVGKVAVRHLR